MGTVDLMVVCGWSLSCLLNASKKAFCTLKNALPFSTSATTMHIHFLLFHSFVLTCLGEQESSCSGAASYLTMSSQVGSTLKSWKVPVIWQSAQKIWKPTNLTRKPDRIAQRCPTDLHHCRGRKPSSEVPTIVTFHKQVFIEAQFS